MSNRNEVYGWHVLPLNKKLRYDDGRKVLLNQPLRAKGPLVMCLRGLHASKTPSDAMYWWRAAMMPGSQGPCWLTIVRLGGQRLGSSSNNTEPQKWCARTRTALGMTKLTTARESKGFRSMIGRLACRVGAVLGKELSIIEVKAKRPKRKKAACHPSRRKRNTGSSASPR